MVLKNLHAGDLDFQSIDEAWYGVRLVLQGETLIVKYCNFSDDHDELFSPANFKDLREVECFVLRFRPISMQLQDNECKKVIEGKTVCASYVFGKDDVRFYDAVVEEVNFKDHKFEKKEECTCTFVLFWLFGPNAGNKTEAVVANICLLQHGNAQMHPTLSRFMEICKNKHKVVSPSPARASEGDVSVRDTSSIRSANLDSFVNNKNRSKEVKMSVSAARTSKVRITGHPERIGEDTDLGGRSGPFGEFTEASNSHFLLLDNLEKDISPSAIVDFMRIGEDTDLGGRSGLFGEFTVASNSHFLLLDNLEKDMSPSAIVDFMRIGEDTDLGGRSGLFREFTVASNSHFLLLDNLEKDLSPSAIVDFMRRHLSINSKAHVFPSLSSELYTKGIIMVDSQVTLQKLSDFLNNPSHIVLSSKGRPWVMTNKDVCSRAITANLIMLPERYQWDKGPEVGDQLRVVSNGTKEYERGKKRKDIFLEFSEHQRILHQRLALEEGKILQSSSVLWT